jgi:DNA-binding transcriptional LysR family regulator
VAQSGQRRRAGRPRRAGTRALLRSAAEATTATRAAVAQRITIGYTAGLIITPAVRELRHRHPDAEVGTLHLAWNEPRAAQLDHRVDAVVARLPFPTDQLHVTVLYDTPRVVVVALDHWLAGKESVTLDDIADEPCRAYGNPPRSGAPSGAPTPGPID